ncbi:Coiled-coil domain-containing protein 87, partial [Choanephora cucurbitarum]
MDIICNHLSTISSLWSSLQIDANTIQHKLNPVIEALELVLENERHEKRLLKADIQDLLTFIEYASDLLGVSLESMLDSNHILLSPDSLLNHPDLHPTYPQQKALNDLYHRLDQEIATRKSHVTEWLMEIRSLCELLVLDYSFKSDKEYQTNDLSWAVIQSISCRLRDLKQLKAERITRFDQTMKSMHAYWHLLDYTEEVPEEAEFDKQLGRLFENFPLDLELSRLMDTIDNPRMDQFYIHPANPFTQLSQERLDQLTLKHNELELLFNARWKTYEYAVHKIKTVWEEFNIPLLERPYLPQRLGAKDMQILKDILDGIGPMIRNKFDAYIQECKEQLTPLWNACLLSEHERDVFIASLYDLNTKLEIETAVNDHRVYLERICAEGQALQALMKERKDLIQKMLDFEKKASDPRRLFQASFQLLEEEKWRRTCLPRLLQLDRQLIKAIDEFEKSAGKPVMIGDKRYLDALLDEIADREANQTFFGFLSSEPVPHSSSSTTTVKRHQKKRSSSVTNSKRPTSLKLR